MSWREFKDWLGDMVLGVTMAFILVALVNGLFSLGRSVLHFFGGLWK